MKVWCVTYGDGYEFSGVVYEVYDDETLADLRCLELNEKLKSQYAGYSVQEFEINKQYETI